MCIYVYVCEVYLCMFTCVCEIVISIEKFITVKRSSNVVNRI